MWRVVGTVVVAALTLGCRNQASTITNPFLTPDRVPPPSTRMPAPGAAQPYYPGDQLPPTALGAPAAGPPTTAYANSGLAAPPSGTYAPAANVFAPNGAPPANSYPGAAPLPSYPAGAPYPGGGAIPSGSAAPVSPPGGWGAYPPQSIGPTPVTPLASLQPAPAQLQIREVTPAEYLAAPQSPSPVTPALATSDGFRPQGSLTTVATTATPTSADRGFRPPGIRSDATSAAGAANAAARFAAGDGYAWLRGQLEYWPESGQWTMRYLSQEQADQYGGRVMIDNPQVLGNLPPGEFVMVEGELFGRQLDEGHYTPTYRVATVQRQRM